MKHDCQRPDLKIWLINLESAHERLTRMTNQLNALRLDYSRFSAIDGETRTSEFSHRIDVPYYEKHMGQRLLPGKVGCYFSHLAVWKKFIASNHPVALILEDDVVFHNDFLEALDLGLATAEHWDLLRLNCTRARIPILQGKVGPYQLNAYLGRFTGNGCYLLKRDVAIRMLPKLENMKLAFEYEIGRFFAHDFRLFGLAPFPSQIEDFGESQIVGVNNSKVVKLTGVKRIPYILNKIMNYFLRFAYLSNRKQIIRCSRQLTKSPDFSSTIQMRRATKIG